jgi:hypothetical protein
VIGAQARANEASMMGRIAALRLEQNDEWLRQRRSVPRRRLTAVAEARLQRCSIAISSEPRRRE